MPFKILYNNCCGAFQTSPAFDAEYKRRTGNEPARGIEIAYLRTDPDAIAIYEEKGSEWCSGAECMLDCAVIPDIFSRYWLVDELYGDETIRILVDQAYADILHTFMATEERNVVILERQYRAIEEAWSLYQNGPPITSSLEDVD